MIKSIFAGTSWRPESSSKEVRSGAAEALKEEHDTMMESGWQGDVNAMAVISFTLPLSCPAVLMS